MIYQTDFNGYIKKYGCLYMSLIDIARDITNNKIKKVDITNIYEILVKDGCMTKTCYVKNHTDTLRIILDYFGDSTNILYSGARYLVGDDSWGKTGGDYIIIQVKAPSFSHFRRIKYDPWRPTLKFNSILSVRYYNVY